MSDPDRVTRPRPLPQAQSDRNVLLAKIHMAKRDLALEEECYRDLLERITGSRSSADLALDRLDQVLAEFRRLGWKPRRGGGRKRPGRPLATSPHARKIRALWLALYQLGVVRDPSEKALAAFARRQTEVDALQWLDPDRAPAVIEALKDMAVREAGVDWSKHEGIGAVRSAKLRVIEAQARLLAAADADLRRAAPDVADWQARRPGWGHSDLDPSWLDRVMVTLGAIVRRIHARDAD